MENTKDNFSTIGGKNRKISSAQSNKRKSIKLEEINSSRLSRLINGETDLLEDEELEGF